MVIHFVERVGDTEDAHDRVVLVDRDCLDNVFGLACESVGQCGELQLLEEDFDFHAE